MRSLRQQSSSQAEKKPPINRAKRLLGWAFRQIRNMADKQTKVFISDTGSLDSKLLRLALMDAGYEISSSADSGFDPVELRCAPPSVILVDIQKYVPETLQKAYWLKTICKVPVVALIAEDKAPLIAQSPVQIDKVLLKPFKLEDVIEVIESFANRIAPCLYRTLTESAPAPGNPESRDNRPEEAPQRDLNLLRVDLEARDVFVDNTPLNLSPMEFKLFELLIAKSGGVVTDDEIAEVLWPRHRGVDDAVIRQYVYRVRKKFERRAGAVCSNLIQNVKGRGYRYLPNVQSPQVAAV